MLAHPADSRACDTSGLHREERKTVIEIEEAVCSQEAAVQREQHWRCEQWGKKHTMPMRGPTITRGAVGLTQSQGQGHKKGEHRWWKWRLLERWDSQSFRAADLNRRESLCCLFCATKFPGRPSQHKSTMTGLRAIVPFQMSLNSASLLTDHIFPLSFAFPKRGHLRQTHHRELQAWNRSRLSFQSAAGRD